jgi:tight adherence protein C
MPLRTQLILLITAVATFGVGGALLWWYSRDRWRAVARLRELSDTEVDYGAQGKPGNVLLDSLRLVGNFLSVGQEERVSRLQTRLTQAGIYSPQMPRVFLGLQVLLAALVPLATGLAPMLLRFASPRVAFFQALAGVAAGIVAPGVWLDWRKRKRQSLLRRALPDALDMLVLCVDGGMSLAPALQRVTVELQTVHPVLAAELNIVQRETQLGVTNGEALKKFAQRCGLDELKELAAVIFQSERFGASVGKSLRAHADGLRLEREQRAEEMAQKAAVKILFPTLLCIFPAVFIVVLGPAFYQIAGMLTRMK